MNFRRPAIGLVLVALACAANAQQARKPYIIQLVDQPVLAYDGKVAGLKATRPAAGTRLNVNAGDVQKYVAYLNSKQSSVAATVPAAKVTYRYKLSLNGFAAWLTDDELAKLVTNPGVRAITADEAVPLDTSYTPKFLGISQGPNGVWTRMDANGRPIKGEDVIIGHMDGGVWPEDPSFSDKVDVNGKPVASHLPGTVVYGAPPAKWTGTCQPSTGASGISFTAADCNNKLIGARYFNATWKLAVSLGLVKSWSGDYVDSPRDADGHGTHTLSTAGGNESTDVSVSGSAFTISGIAPRARVAAYKVCYVPADANDVPQQGSCYNSDSVAAIDQAVADGVDVINFSIGGSRTSFRDAVQTAFANASINGVFVSASAGNSGPGNTVAHVSPWLMTVGNSTHDRYTEATVTLGNGTTAQGASFQTAGLPVAPLVWSRDAGFAAGQAAPGSNQALCYGAADGVAPLLDPAKVKGKVVICDRGGNVLVNKVANARAAGAVGVIIQNTTPANNSTPLIVAVLPTVHLPVSAFAAVTGHAGTPGATAAFSPSFLVAGVIAPVMANSSSRGPNQGDLNVLKPDITGPGTDIIAAYTNTSITPQQRLDIISGVLPNPGPGANMISGTSMSSPHVAGAAALLRQANPTWSPYAIKSALMTSALQNVKLANGNPDPSPWGYGAGHLNPNVALDTTVVYDQSIFDHINYYNGAINGRQLNLASLTHANVVGIGTLTRTLSNKGNAAVTYNASASLPGFTVTVSPSTLTIPAGGSATYTVTMTRTPAAPIEQWAFGNVTWSGAGLPTLRSPLTAKPSNIVAISDVTDTRSTGTKVYTVGFGYDGTLSTTGFGLQPATVVHDSVPLNQSVCFAFAVPAGAKTLRVQLFNVDTEGGSASDLDLRVLRGATTVGTSGGADSNELVSIPNPTAAANYQACVDGYAPVNGLAKFKLSYWVLGPTNPNTLKAFGPSKVTIGGVASIGISWNVPGGARYLGQVEYRQSAGGAMMGSTQVFIDASAPVPAPVMAPVYREKHVN